MHTQISYVHLCSCRDIPAMFYVARVIAANVCVYGAFFMRAHAVSFVGFSVASRMCVEMYSDTSAHSPARTHRIAGFKKIYTGKSQLQTGHVPRGIVGEFDIMTCRDLGNGEVQYFRYACV